MVKADPKHDYYADLEIPPNSDAEAIKKQFRLLAKQYHPDRNPGHEIECVPKFQAVQAAHEILSDPDKKAKYDAERAKSVSKPDPYGFKRSQTTKVPPPASPFPPAARPRNSSVDRSQFNARNQPSSASAEKFAPFTRAPPQQWDRARYEDAGKADALRNFQHMRGQAQPPPPPRPPRAPTAPKSASAGMSPDFVNPNIPPPPPGFPGLSRTQSARRPVYPNVTPTNDDSPAKSAYAYVNGRNKPSPTTSYPYPPPPTGNPATSPPSQRSRPSVSPLRQTRSSHFDPPQSRPAFERTSSRYATGGGEKTDVHGLGVGRSASVRTSPVDRTWPENGPFGAKPKPEFKSPPTRHRSASPKLRPDGTRVTFASDTSGSEEEPTQNNDRPKATPRKPRRPQSERGASASENDPALTQQFPNTNYTRLVDDDQYQYPPPESRDTPYRRPFEPRQPQVDDIISDMRTTGIRHVHKDDIGRTNQSDSRTDSISAENPHHTPFSASEWDGKFTDGENVFVPSEKDRRSPTKSGRKPTSRTRAHTTNSTVEVDDTDDDISPTIPGVRHVHSSDSRPTAAAFKKGTFSADEWAERFKNQTPLSPNMAPQNEAPNVSGTNLRAAPLEKETVQSVPTPNSTSRRPSANPDEMDVDSNDTPATSMPPPPPVNGARLNSTTTFSPVPPAQQGARQNSSSSVNMSDLKYAAPFASPAEGLNSLQDLDDNLPFQSRSADFVESPQKLKVNLRNLNLPLRPKPVAPPDQSELTQETWSRYSEKMTAYMHDWNIFNCKMIDHFRIRQEQVNLSMYHNWVTAVGDGASADQFHGLDVVQPTPSVSDARSATADGKPGANGNTYAKVKAGYATYMQWLEQDSACREWWDIAFEEHRQCLEGLGKVRTMVKAIRARG